MVKVFVIHFFNKYLSNAFHMLNVILSARDKIENEREEIPALMKLTFQRIGHV